MDGQSCYKKRTGAGAVGLNPGLDLFALTGDWRGHIDQYTNHKITDSDRVIVDPSCATTLSINGLPIIAFDGYSREFFNRISIAEAFQRA